MMTSHSLQALTERFHALYGDQGPTVRQFFAPGRVNLMGDHTDYNGGWVLPCAIDRGTTLLARKTTDRSIKLASTNFNLVAFLSPEELGKKFADHWINYPIGCFEQLRQCGHHPEGLELLYSGNIPNGGGLSSSASLSVVTLYALNAVLDLQIQPIELVKLAQRAENDFVGVHCGIMDQFASMMGKAGHAMALDCNTLEVTQTPLRLSDHALVIINSNQRRELTESGYNERFTQSQQALKALQRHVDIDNLAAASSETLATYHHTLTDTEYRRARHVINEHQAVLSSIAALNSGDLAHFGALMNASHRSLAEDYAVSTPILDQLVEIAQSHPACLGARLTGAGFGGCTINLVKCAQLSEFKQTVSQRYHQATGLSADCYAVQASDGARELTP